LWRFTEWSRGDASDIDGKAREGALFGEKSESNALQWRDRLDEFIYLSVLLSVILGLVVFTSALFVFYIVLLFTAMR